MADENHWFSVVATESDGSQWVPYDEAVKLVDRISDLEMDVERLDADIAAIRGDGQEHDASCALVRERDNAIFGPCTCGLDKQRAAIADRAWKNRWRRGPVSEGWKK